MNFPDSYGFEPGKKIIQKKINFNWKEYLIANTDLIEIGINNEELAKGLNNLLGTRVELTLALNTIEIFFI